MHVTLTDPFGTKIAEGDLTVNDYPVDADTTVTDQLKEFWHGTQVCFPLQGSTPNAALPLTLHVSL